MGGAARVVQAQRRVGDGGLHGLKVGQGVRLGPAAPEHPHEPQHPPPEGERGHDHAVCPGRAQGVLPLRCVRQPAVPAGPQQHGP